MSDDLIERLEMKASVMEMGEKIAWGSDTALMREAAARIRELEQGVAAEPLEWECIGRTWKAAAPFFGSFRVEHYGDEKWKALWSVPGYCDTFVEGDFVTANEAKNAIQNRIRSALTPAPVTDEARERVARAIYEAEGKLDPHPECWPNWSDCTDYHWWWHRKADAALSALAGQGGE